ncbi:VOC family protein [Candidatus Bipolaricaulota bacterium]|nr:VOC family protein [Candidatus Bipolaricaulota bacterium]
MKDNTQIIDHLGFVVEDAKETLKRWEELFDVEGSIREYEKEQVVLASIKINGIKFVFNEPMTDDTRWAEILRNKGEGIEHICFSNFNFDEKMKKAKKLGMTTIYDEPEKDPSGRRHNIISDEDLHATKVEFKEPPK